MSNRRWLPLAIFIGLAVLLAAGVIMSRNPDRDALPSPLIGKPAPELDMLYYQREIAAGRAT